MPLDLSAIHLDPQPAPPEQQQGCIIGIGASDFPKTNDTVMHITQYFADVAQTAADNGIPLENIKVITFGFSWVDRKMSTVARSLGFNTQECTQWKNGGRSARFRVVKETMYRTCARSGYKKYDNPIGVCNLYALANCSPDAERGSRLVLHAVAVAQLIGGVNIHTDHGCVDEELLRYARSMAL